MPVNPVSAENSAPTRKNAERPQRTPVPSAGSSSTTKNITTTNTPSVRNGRLMDAAAPSSAAAATPLIFGVPLPAPTTPRTNNAATPTAPTATPATPLTP